MLIGGASGWVPPKTDKGVLPAAPSTPPAIPARGKLSSRRFNPALPRSTIGEQLEEFDASKIKCPFFRRRAADTLEVSACLGCEGVWFGVAGTAQVCVPFFNQIVPLGPSPTTTHHRD